jgi:hypothetical protein
MSIATEVNVYRNLKTRVVKQYPLGAGSAPIDSIVVSVEGNE